MATTKVTITLDDEQLAAARKLAARGKVTVYRDSSSTRSQSRQITTAAEGRVSGVTFDAGGLIALDRNDRRVIVLLARAHELGQTVTVPATALAQAIRRPRSQTRLSKLIRQPNTDVVALDGPDASQVGVLLAATGTRDIVDAHVVICARRSQQPIVTGDSEDLRRLDPRAVLIAV